LNNDRYLIVIVGPTAVGKTNLCIEIARKLKCEIISADSRQFFKELSIGTAKPTRATLNLLPKLFKKNHLALMTGGSGLYIQAVCQGMNDIPQVEASFRDSLYLELKVHGLSALLEELSVKDPEYYKIVDRNNTQRIVRALEICRGTGFPYSSYRIDNNVIRDFKIMKIGLDRGRDELFARIDARIDNMIEAGLFDEAEQLIERRHFNALKTVGYKEVFGFLDGEYNRAETVRLLKRNTRRYAKRQLTWFQKDPEFTWFHPDNIEDILSFIQKGIFIQ